MLILAAGLCSTGCTTLTEWVKNEFKVGPNYEQPPAPLSEAWTHASDPRVQCDSTFLCCWWSVFHDPVLDELIERARQQNLDLKKAEARIEETHAGQKKACGDLFPQSQQNVAGYGHGQISKNLTQGAFPRIFDLWFDGFYASWEVDLWGKIRRRLESARADVAAAEDEYHDVLVTLLSDVAANYIRLRAYQQRIAFARRNVEIQKGTLAIARNRFEAGKAAETDVQQARLNLAQTESSIAPLVAGWWDANNKLCVLLGVPVHELTQLSPGGPMPSAPVEVAVGIPADLLRRRPDVRRSEREAASQCEQIGIAEAEFYPSVSVVGFLGYTSNELEKLFSQQSYTGVVLPNYTWKILNYGRLVNNVRMEDARFKQKILAYQQQVLHAGEEVETALVAFLQAQAQARSLEEGVDAADRYQTLILGQYQEGSIDYDRVFRAQETLVQQQDRLATAQQDVALNLIKVYRALGGGWESVAELSGGGCKESAARGEHLGPYPFNPPFIPGESKPPSPDRAPPSER